jgi:hypothetical protein
MWQDEADFEAISKTRPRIIIALFPRVVAGWDGGRLSQSPPGSFVTESDQAPYSIELCIYLGRGLPGWSPLVMRGKEQYEEQVDFLVRAIEDTRKTAYKRASENRKVSANSSLGTSIGRV